MDIFEQASRLQVRFASNRGDLTAEQLWELPLTSKSGFDLDSVAKGVNNSLKSVTEESFVATSTNPAKAGLELKLEIVKRVIAVKMEENAAALDKAKKAQERAKLIDILGQKQDAALLNLTPEQIQERLAALDK